MKYKNYIWDFDGTLFDSYPHILRCWEMVCDEDGIVYDRTELWRRILVSFGVGRKYTNWTDEQYSRFRVYELALGDDEIEPKVVLFPKAAEVLKKITENGGRNYLYTHRDLTSAQFYLKKFGLSELFDSLVTSDDKFPLKPSPKAVEAIINRHGLRPCETVMVGDRIIDGMSGVNAGIDGILITAASDAAGDYDAEALERCGNSYIEGHGYADMARVLKNIEDILEI